MKLSPNGQKINWTFCMGIIFMILVATVLAVTNFKQKRVLKIDVPENAVISKWNYTL